MYSVTEYQYQQLRNYYPTDSVVLEIGRQPLKEESSISDVQLLNVRAEKNMETPCKMKLIHGADYIRNDKGEPIEFSSIESCLRFGDRRMPNDLRVNGFSAVICASYTEGAWRLNYAKQDRGE